MAVNMNALLEGLVKFNASDLHLKVGGPPMIRLHGVLRPVDHPTLMPEDTESANDQMMPERCREQLDAEARAEERQARAHGSADQLLRNTELRRRARAPASSARRRSHAKSSSEAAVIE